MSDSKTDKFAKEVDDRSAVKLAGDDESETAGSAYVTIKNVSKEYVNRRTVARTAGDPVVANKEFTVLDDISLEFKEGEMVCILGPSGCGKSTLLRILAGFDTASSGQVTIDNKLVTGPSANNIFVFQQCALLPWMSVWDNVELGLRHMEDEEERAERIQEYIELVELAGFENNYPYQLSGGMQRRAELARALAVKPDLLFMDEPFTGLDYFTHLKIREEVVNLHEYIGKTMIMVTHFIEDALVMADRIIVLSERPTMIKMECKLDFPRPRNIVKDQGLADLRDEIFLMLGVSYVA
jgi:ABC-type nitrate/sulfonate/bicarbonate transport system ATPase subunit